MSILAAGCLFTALTAAPHALSFPGLFAPTGLMGAGPQTTAWLYLVWHVSFPLAVIAYALLKDEERTAEGPRGSARTPILTSVAGVICSVCALTLNRHARS
jgi:two-component system sensor histidine kinase UhpB